MKALAQAIKLQGISCPSQPLGNYENAPMVIRQDKNYKFHVKKLFQYAQNNQICRLRNAHQQARLSL